MQFLPILDRPSFADPELRTSWPMLRTNPVATIGEGFGQKTDRHCSHYQYIARGRERDAMPI